MNKYVDIFAQKFFDFSPEDSAAAVIVSSPIPIILSTDQVSSTI